MVRLKVNLESYSQAPQSVGHIEHHRRQSRRLHGLVRSRSPRTHVQASKSWTDKIPGPSLDPVRCSRLRPIEGLLTQINLYSRTPNLERLSLGNKAADHNLYSSLPRSLTYLCVALPENHVNARLPDMATMITTRLKKLIRFELYSQIYFPSTDIYYPPTSKSDPSQLREVRLSHIRGPPGTLDSFLASLGSTLHTLALHHVSANFESTLFAHCPKLRRLELGRSQYTEVPATNRFSTVQLNYLHTLRVHFDSTLSVDDIVQEVEASRIAGTHLRTLEIMGTFPGDVPEGEDIGWATAGEIDRLMNAVKAYGTMLLIQGRVIESTGDLWVALFAMSQND